MSTRKTKRVKRRGKRRQIQIARSNEGPLQLYARDTRVYRTLQPARMFVKLKVQHHFTLSGASSTIVARMSPNSAYTPVTGGSSGTTPGYDDWTRLYGYYMVVSYSYSVQFTNIGASSVSVYCLNTNADPTTSAAVTTASNRLCQRKLCAPTGSGQSQCQFRVNKMTIAEVVGSNRPLTDDLYSALLNASPSDITWLGLGAQTVAGGNLTSGIEGAITLSQDIMFFDPLPQSASYRDRVQHQFRLKREEDNKHIKDWHKTYDVLPYPHPHNTEPPEHHKTVDKHSAQ